MLESHLVRHLRPWAGPALALLLAACNQAEEPPAATPTTQKESSQVPEVPPADTVFLNGYVYTADAGHTVAQAIAVRGDRIVFVGSNSDARAFVGDQTQIVGLDGKMMLPGLHDTHIHVLGLVQPNACDLNSEPLSLEQISAQVKTCLERYPLSDGWLMVNQWNFAAGNQATTGLPTLRAALDAASKNVPIFLRGNDGHHAAVNSAALKRATDAQGQRVGLSAATLDSRFQAFREYIGVGADGAPNGALSEGARQLVNPPDLWGFTQIDPAQIPLLSRVLAWNGITSVQDAATPPTVLPLFEALAAHNEMYFRLTATLYPNLNSYRAADSGAIRIPAVLADLRKIREQYAGHPLIKATAAKIFIDGVLEGDPYSDPPTLPNAAVLHPYRQPLFKAITKEPGIEITGYVDLDDEPCRTVQSHAGRYTSAAPIKKFRSQYGFHPRQCEVSYGRLEHDEAFIRNYMHALAHDGFAIQAHAIGDRAVRVAVANFAELRREFGGHTAPYIIAHAQLVHPDDRRRIGALGLYVAFTFSWMAPNPAYDLLVTPFISRVKDNALYDAKSYMMRNAYPVQSILKAGGIIVAGSDVPVDTRDPRPFYQMALAVSRANEDGLVYNAAERISIHDAIAAYTRNAAAAMQQEDLTGTLAVGRKADVIVLNQNIVELAERSEFARLAATQVVTTIFNGETVFQAN
jgi:hypothetical protein